MLSVVVGERSDHPASEYAITENVWFDSGTRSSSWYVFEYTVLLKPSAVPSSTKRRYFWIERPQPPPVGMCHCTTMCTASDISRGLPRNGAIGVDGHRCG